MKTQKINGQEFEVEDAGEFAMREPVMMKLLVHEEQFRRMCGRFGVNPEKCRANWVHWMNGGMSPLPGAYRNRKTGESETVAA